MLFPEFFWKGTFSWLDLSFFLTFPDRMNPWTKFNFELFSKKINFMGFNAVVLVNTFPLMYQLLMYDWYRWRSIRGTDKIQFRTFSKNQLFGFSRCSTIDVSITNVGLILTKPGWFLYPGYRQTDRRTRFWNPDMETRRLTKNFNSKLKISG